MNLIKTGLYSGISTALTFISGFIVAKVIAVKIGPPGMAFVGQFQNAMAILGMLASCAIASGVVKYLATFREEPSRQQQVITSSITLILVSSGTVSLLVMSASGFLSRITFHSMDFWPVYLLLGLFLGILALNTLFAAILNGYKEIKYLTIINIMGTLSSILCTVGFAYTLGVKGVLIANNFSALVILGFNVYYLRKLPGISWKPSLKKMDPKTTRMLLAFTLMGMVSGIVVPSMQLLVRDRIMTHFSIQDAGYWQAVTRISDYYLLFITTVLGIYYLPRLSEIKTRTERRAEIIKGYKIILPVVGIMAFLIWLCKVWIVHLLFTADFLPMLPLFKYQLLGDFMKIGSWLLGFIILSRALTKTFILTEISFGASFVILSYWLMEKFGLIGTTYAFCINYTVYWVVMWFLMRKYI
jgi:PST family polysaccharide transporter